MSVSFVLPAAWGLDLVTGPVSFVFCVLGPRSGIPRATVATLVCVLVPSETNRSR